MSLRGRLVRLAYIEPTLRADLLPLIRSASRLPPAVAQWAAALKIPPTATFHRDTLTWAEAHGSTGARVADNVRDAALRAGFRVVRPASVLGGAAVYQDRARNELQIEKSFGATSNKNQFSITVKFSRDTLRQFKKP
jgi:hypothetical protein